jgi:hypothetical protein
VRGIVNAYEGIVRLVSSLTSNQIRSSTVMTIFMDLPTLVMMSSFSFFIYYIGQLTIQLEISKQSQFGKWLSVLISLAR